MRVGGCVSTVLGGTKPLLWIILQIRRAGEWQGSEPSLHFHTRLGEPICWKSLREYLLRGGRGGKLRACTGSHVWEPPKACLGSRGWWAAFFPGCRAWPGVPQLLLLLGTTWAQVEQLDFFTDEGR